MPQPCTHHPTCPGCPLRDHEVDEQLQIKRDRLDQALRAFGHLELRAPPVQQATHTDAYRHRLKLPVRHDRHGGVAIGLADRATSRTLDTPSCVVLRPELREGLDHVRAWLAGRTEVHSVDLRWSDHASQAQLVLACLGGSLKGGRKAVATLRAAWPALTSVAVSQADPERKRVMGRRPQRLDGDAFLPEAIGDTRYRLYPGAFFQVDPRNATQILDHVRQGVGEARTLLDLYAGVGTWALALAEGRERVVAVEEVRQAAEAARAEAPPQVSVHATRVEDLPMDEPFDAVIVNPARRGCRPEVLHHVNRLTDRLVYVSCSPETLARDLDLLAAQGLRVQSMAAVDLFPQTPEVETVTVLTRGEPLRTWRTRGGTAGSPWGAHPSGATGRPDEVIALVIGDTGPGGRLGPSRFERLGTVATHSLVRLFLRGPMEAALRDLARRGRPTAGHDPRTARFFEDKAGLVRPFVHVSRAGRATAPLHGDLVLALRALGAPEALIDQANRPAPRRGAPR